MNRSGLPAIWIVFAVTSTAFGQYALSTVAGGGPANGTPATSVALSYAYGVAFDSSGNMYIPSPTQSRVYKVSAGGSISTAAGTGTRGFSGDNGPAVSAQLGNPSSVAIDGADNLYIVDGSRIRRVTAGVITTVVGNGTQGYYGDGVAAVTAIISSQAGIAVDTSGNLYIADYGNFRIRKVVGGVITTIAGDGTNGFSGDNGPATSGQISLTNGIAADSGGAVYIADKYNSRIRKISSGVITTVAGSSSGGFSGDGGPAVSAELSWPNGVAVDSAGNLYIADSFNYRIRKVSGGVISTVAGLGTQGYSGDGGPAASALLGLTNGVTVNAAGNLYIGDGENFRIRKVSSGVITTVAGNGAYGSSGDGGPATSAQVTPNGLAVDGAGNIYVAEGDTRIRKVSGGVIATAAGNGSFGFFGDGGPATIAQIGQAQNVAVDGASSLYLTDGNAHRVRKVAGGVINTIAGNGDAVYSGDGGAATSAGIGYMAGLAASITGDVYFTDSSRVRKISGGVVTLVAGGGPQDGAVATSVSIFGSGMASDSSGNIYIPYQHRIYKLASNGTLRTVAGNGTSGFSGDGGPATAAQLNDPFGVAVDNAGNLYIADTENSRVRKVSGGVITTVAGNGTYGFSGDDGPATSAQLRKPYGVAADNAGNLYIADTLSSRIRKVTGGVITTAAGDGGFGSYGDGVPATSASIGSCNNVVVDSAGNLYLTDSAGFRIRKISGGVISTVAGNGIDGFSGDGGAATDAAIGYPYALAVDNAGSLYIGDIDHARVRKVTGGLISTVAGIGSRGFSGDGGPATSASISNPIGVAADGAGNLYISDGGNYHVRRVSGGVIDTVAGNGAFSDSGDGGLASNAQLNNPSALAVDSSGNLYVADSQNYRVRVVSSGGVISTFAGGGTQTGDGGLATNALLDYPEGLAVDGAHNIYIANGNNRLRQVSGGVIGTISATVNSVPVTMPNISSVAADSTGNLYIAGLNGSFVWKLSQSFPTLTLVGTIAPEPSIAGQAYSVGYTVTSSGGTPTGNVSLSDGFGISICTVAAGTCSITSSTAGSKTITVTYIGTGAFSGSFATKTHVVSPAASVPPSPGTVNSISGSGASHTFVYTFFDPDGWQDLGVVNILINKALDGNNACYMAYDRPSNVLYLVSDAGSGLTGLTLNGLGSVSNSQCTVNGAGSSASGTGNTLTLTLSISFSQSGFGGEKITYVAARDAAQNNSGWRTVGVWSVPRHTPVFPSIMSVTPSEGGGSTQTFTVTYRDVVSSANLRTMQFLVNSALDGTSACYLGYDHGSNQLYFVNDDNSGLLFPGIAPNSGSGNVQNSQCAINGVGTLKSESGTDLTLVISLTFKPSFTGPKVVFTGVQTISNANSDWHVLGFWNVP